MPTSNSIHELFAELPRECATWAIKIGDPVEVRYSDSLLHLWAVMELLTLYRPAQCSYVEIMGRGGCYSRFFRAGRMIVLGAKSSVATAFYEEACVQSLELKTLRTKDALCAKKTEVLSLELF
jgi:hypothetical protein